MTTLTISGADGAGRRDRCHRYMLLLHQDPSGFARLSPEQMQAAVEKYMAWGKQLRRSRVSDREQQAHRRAWPRRPQQRRSAACDRWPVQRDERGPGGLLHNRGGELRSGRRTAARLSSPHVRRHDRAPASRRDVAMTLREGEAETRLLVDHLFRSRAGQMVAWLTRIFGPAHIDLAEEVVQDALVKALQQWPYKGVPENPGGWLLAVARNGAVDVLRRNSAFASRADAIVAEIAKSDVPAGSRSPRCRRRRAAAWCSCAAIRRSRRTLGWPSA